jgi:hypothetical protein
VVSHPSLWCWLLLPALSCIAGIPGPHIPGASNTMSNVFLSCRGDLHAVQLQVAVTQRP